jgi:anti-anti-sigma regulatory factor
VGPQPFRSREEIGGPPVGPDQNSMQITTADGPGDRVITLSGDIGRDQVAQLRSRLLDGVERADADVLIDTHQVSAFDDAALAALTSARKRSRFLRHRIVVLAGEDGAVAISLRRNGMHIRMPVFPDAATASRHLAADRETRHRLTLRQATAPASEPGPAGLPELRSDAAEAGLRAG